MLYLLLTLGRWASNWLFSSPRSGCHLPHRVVRTQSRKQTLINSNCNYYYGSLCKVSLRILSNKPQLPSSDSSAWPFFLSICSNGAQCTLRPQLSTSSIWMLLFRSESSMTQKAVAPASPELRHRNSRIPALRQTQTYSLRQSRACDKCVSYRHSLHKKFHLPTKNSFSTYTAEKKNHTVMSKHIQMAKDMLPFKGQLEESVTFLTDSQSNISPLNN